MFRKAQVKLFATITAILLAIFIAVLGSVNLITEAVIEKQSKEILAQIAEDVEYDDETGEFTYYGKMEPRRDDRFDFNNNDQPPSKPDGQPGTDEHEKPEDTTAEVTEDTTAEESQPSTPGGNVNPPSQPPTSAPEKPTEAQTEAPTQPFTLPEETQAPTETEPETAPFTFPDEPWEFPSDPWGGERPSDPWGGERPSDPWGGERPDDPWGGGRRFATDDTETDTASAAVYSFDDDEGGIVALANTDVQTTTMPKNDHSQGTGSQQFGGDHNEPEPKSGNSVPKTLGTINFFVIMADPDGNYLATLNNDDLSDEAAQAYITEILKADAESGRVNNYQFCQTKKDNGTLMVFTDKSGEMDMLSKLNRTTVIIGAISVIMLSAAAFFLSKQIMKPLKSAFERQKQFISDASHELKTPLTVISANADVLSDEIGENKWLTYIKAQTDRMNVLVNDLLNLTRLENNTSSFIRTDFNLSQAITNTALPFECQAFETNKKFIVDVEDGITVNGSEQHIRQMAAIFIDNALKYSNEGGMVRVMLKKQGDKGVLTVYNTGQGIRESERDKIFERFYRSDESRNRATGGYGLGLAIAKSIIDKHKFKVQVEGVEGKNVSFIVTM